MTGRLRDDKYLSRFSYISIGNDPGYNNPSSDANFDESYGLTKDFYPKDESGEAMVGQYIEISALQPFLSYWIIAVFTSSVDCSQYSFTPATTDLIRVQVYSTSGVQTVLLEESGDSFSNCFSSTVKKDQADLDLPWLYTTTTTGFYSPNSLFVDPSLLIASTISQTFNIEVEYIISSPGQVPPTNHLI